MRRKKFGRPLFDVGLEKTVTENEQQETKIVHKKRGRPKKFSTTEFEPKKIVISNTTNENIKEDIEENSENWNLYISGVEHPETFRPCNFKISGSKKFDTCLVYFVNKGLVCDEPYFLHKNELLKGGIEWQYIDKCLNLEECPDGFPNCRRCKKSEVKKNG